MNIKLCILFLISLPSIVFSQIGIGIFKINETKIDIIDSLNNVIRQNLKVHFTLNNEKVYNTPITDLITEIRRDSIKYNEGNSRSYVDTSINVYYINYFKIGQFPVTEIYLTFYKNILVGFRCVHTDEFIKAFEAKFGLSIKETKSKIVTCQNGFGATYNYEEMDIFYHWPYLEKNISANAFTSLTYTNECNPFFYYDFTLSDKLKFKVIENLEKKYKDIYDSKIKQLELNKLKGF